MHGFGERRQHNLFGISRESGFGICKELQLCLRDVLATYDKMGILAWIQQERHIQSMQLRSDVVAFPGSGSRPLAARRFALKCFYCSLWKSYCPKKDLTSKRAARSSDKCKSTTTLFTSRCAGIRIISDPLV